MKIVRAKQIGLVLLIGCVVFSLINFIKVDKGHRSTGKRSPEDPKQIFPSAADNFHVSNGEREFQRSYLNVLSGHQPEPDSFVDFHRNSFEDRFDKYNENIKRPNSFTFNGLTRRPAIKLQLLEKSKFFSEIINRRVKTKITADGWTKKSRKRMKRFLVEYSPFSDNEKLRENVLQVSTNNSKVDRSVWFHRTTNADGTTDYDDGILEQLRFVPRSYARKLQTLSLYIYRKNSSTIEKKVKLDKYLRNEIKALYYSSGSSLKSSAVWDLTGKVPRNISSHRSNSKSSKPNWNSLLRVIYLPEGLPSMDLMNKETLSHEGCAVSACHITDDPRLSKTAHLKVFQNIPIASGERPDTQIWVLWLLESPVNTFIINELDMYINWTATYRWDSTVVTPYAKFVPGSSYHMPELSRNPVKKNYAAGKTKLVAWFVSNCFTSNNRMEFVQELKKYIDVDIYGKCGTFNCSKDDKEKCYTMLSSKYKFYLAFENSNCDSYITEKLFENALGNDIVPIVMGARRSDYERTAPPNSFIHVEDFGSVKGLADYLLLVDKNDTLYSTHLEWKEKGSFIDTKFWCRLCAMLQDDDKPHMWYKDIESWWKHTRACRIGRWKRPSTV